MRDDVSLQIYDTPKLYLALYYALSLAVGCCRCHFQSNHISHCRTVSHRQVKIFRMLNIPQASTMLCWITSLIMHTTQLSLMWTSTDLPQISGIFLWFPQNYLWLKIKAKIMRCPDQYCAPWSCSKPESWFPSAEHKTIYLKNEVIKLVFCSPLTSTVWKHYTTLILWKIMRTRNYPFKVGSWWCI